MNLQTAFVISPFVVLRNNSFNEEIGHFYGKSKAFMKYLPWEKLRSVGIRMTIMENIISRVSQRIACSIFPYNNGLLKNHVSKFAPIFIVQCG